MVAANYFLISTMEDFYSFQFRSLRILVFFFFFLLLFLLHGGLERRMEYAARISRAKSSMYYVERYFLSRCICHCKSTHRHMSQFAYDWPPQINSLYRNRPDLRVCVN